MNNGNIIRYVFYGIVGIVAVLGFIYIFSAPTLDAKDIDLKFDDHKMMSGTSMVLNLSYILIIVCAASAVLFNLFLLASNPKALKSTLINLGVFAILFVIGYAMAGSEVLKTDAKFHVNESNSKVIGGLLNATAIMFLLAIVAALYSTLKSVVKR